LQDAEPRFREEAVLILAPTSKDAALSRKILEEAGLECVLCRDVGELCGGIDDGAGVAMLGDVIVGEPKALIGFAGPRVIEQTVREKLPEGFQRSEFLLEHGAIDMIIHRQELRPRLGNLLAQMMGLPTPQFVAAPIEPIVVPPVPANL